MTTTLQELLRWLAAPISGAVDHQIAPWAYWHARLMVLGWNILLPVGMLSARFFKVMPRQDWPRELDRSTWWRTHLALQSLGIGIVSLGFLMALGHGQMGSRLAGLHHVMGWAIMVAGWLQVVGGLLRGSKGGPTAASMRGDHYDMTRRRVLFEHVHKHLGWLTLPPVLVATGIGLVLADAPRWMPIVLAIWWALFIIVFVWLQRRGHCVDTYQAIWGPDPSHPGNTRKQIGWGMLRHQHRTVEERHKRDLDRSR